MEGPSIVILKEEVQQFNGKKVLKAEGNTKIDKTALIGQSVTAFKSWGKHFIICFSASWIRVHFLMFGSYRVNERKDAVPRLSLAFENGELNMYTCAVAMLDQHPDEIYDYEVDVLSDSWNQRKAIKGVKQRRNLMVGDVLLDQEVFAGVGNIIKNEALFRAKIHPETLVSHLSTRQRKALIDTTREYSFDFYHWKKQFLLKKHWQVYTKRKCPRCNIPVTKKHTGVTKRRSFFCSNCQILY